MVDEILIGYCQRCNKKVIVKDGVKTNKETKRGVKVFVNGHCFSCGNKINCLLCKGL
jgi:hypothetical protein